MPPRLKYEIVRQYYSDNNCKLISTEYFTKKHKLDFIAECGHNDNCSFAHYQLRQTNKCIDCISPFYMNNNRDYMQPRSFKKIQRIMERKFNHSLKYRNDFLPENYNQIINCWDCKKTKNRKLFPYRKQYKDNKEKRCKQCNNKNSQYRKDNHTINQIIRDMLKTAQHAAKRRKKSGRQECGIFTITIDDIVKLKKLQNNKCIYTGQDLIWEYNHNYKVSIDRIDSNKGYIPENIQLVSKVANQAKNNLTESEFLIMIKQIYQTTIQSNSVHTSTPQ